MPQPEVVEVARHYWPHGLVTGVVGWLGKVLFKSWQERHKLLTDIHTELVEQRTNCLGTLQAQGEKQIELLEGIGGDIREQTGFLKGALKR